MRTLHRKLDQWLVKVDKRFEEWNRSGVKMDTPEELQNYVDRWERRNRIVNKVINICLFIATWVVYGPLLLLSLPVTIYFASIRWGESPVRGVCTIILGVTLAVLCFIGIILTNELKLMQQQKGK